MNNIYPAKATKPMKAIRLFCGECMGMDRRKKKKSYPFVDVRECTDEYCPLFEWRFGTNPYKSQSRVESGLKLAQRSKAVLQSTSQG